MYIIFKFLWSGNGFSRCFKIFLISVSIYIFICIYIYKCHYSRACEGYVVWPYSYYLITKVTKQKDFKSKGTDESYGDMLTIRFNSPRNLQRSDPR